MISLNEIRNRAIIFSHEWERDYNEDAEAKSFWDGFFDVFGVSRRRVASFEYPIKKMDGGQGYIDVLWKGVLLAEHKTRGKNLDKAYTQAKDYFPGLKDQELPRYIIVSDFEKFRFYDLESNTQKEFLLKDLHNNIELFDFISGYRVQVYEKEEEASIEAAKLMADFHNEIAKTGYSGHNLEVFLIRILFCLFADDTGIFPKGHFRSYLENRINKDGSDLGIHLMQIFHVLNTPKEKRQTNLDEQLMSFDYINGGIFAEQIAPVSLDATAYLKLIKCCSFDWSKISASIFGSLFQGVMDDNTRRQLGAHYTSEINILKVIHSLFLDELYIEFDKVKYDQKKLDIFHKKLASLTFLDPACGCGNFLVVAYRELRKLEIEVLLKKRKEMSLKMFGADELSLININQFYGIEIEEFPSLVARVAMYLADHQMNQMLSERFGEIYARIPLREPASIVKADALLINWEEIIPKDKLSYILGNPPFIGAMLMTKVQHDNLGNVFGTDIKNIGVLDFVTAWYEKAAQYIQGTKIKVSFVSTNSIVQGEQVIILWKRLSEKYGIVIHFAHQTFKWTNDAPGVAGVYCVIIGFASFVTEKKYLFEYETVKSEPKEKEVENINAYLIASANIFLENRKKPLCDSPEIVFGNMPRDGGNLLLSNTDRDEIIKTEPQVEKWIKPYIAAKEFLHNEKRWCLWLINISPEEIKNSPFILSRVEATRLFRLKSKAKSTQNFAKTPTLFAQIAQPKTSYVLIPRHSSERREYIPMGFFNNNDIVADSCMAVKEASIYEFGILHSIQHMVWVSHVCGRLESRYRYSKDIVYNNFPWPQEPKEEHRKRVEESAQKVLDARKLFPNSSLSDLYDPNTMPPELTNAHNNLNRAVDECYGQKFQNKEERIEFLFNLYKKIISSNKK